MKKFRAPKIVTLIGEGTEIDGNVTFKGGLHVDGSVRGNVLALDDDKATLTLSDMGNIEGDVQVPQVILNGTVIGDVHASQRLELAPRAKVTGTVYYKLLEMAMGAEVNGSLVHSEEQEIKRLSHQPQDWSMENQGRDQESELDQQ